ncbi:MAG: DUF5117 domain-containing protein, partial [Alphaproteobacteria bacterium]|nr:DUF5117 domain-containing protein [Alphaproteobacteria bacterium]
MRYFAVIFALAVVATGCSEQQANSDAPEPVEQAAPAPSQAWSDAVNGMDRRDGFIKLYVDEAAGKLFAAFPAPSENGTSLRAIYSAGLSAGLGSNPIGLDRGLFDEGAIVAFRRYGNKIIAEQENWNYRASADNPLEKKAVKQSFARSFIWSGEIIAEGPDGELLVDFQSFVLRDALDVVGTLKHHKQGGDFVIVADRSMADFSEVLTFPDNIEIDAFLTLVSDAPKREVVATAANPRAITLTQHHSLTRLPDDGYTPRKFDPRAAAIDVPYYDFSAPLKGEVRQAFARRFRLEKQNPEADRSPAKKPIVFYVDSGAPAQIRDALIEGASWWADAFDAAGFTGAFRVEPLPEGAHPRDIRYNTISWTHRQTRGWSYGGGVYDPRTGEMIKASVILGSQRVRQDRMIIEGLAGVAKSGTGADDDAVEIALDRIRQLSAHEVGHTLGFAHNFAASTNDRASVMDYPAPHVTVMEDGGLDFSAAYGVGVGAWDKLAATWLYAQFPPAADEAAGLETILRDGYARGLRFVGDRDGRPLGAAHPYASVWDNGEDAVAALEEALAVRAIALGEFGERSLQNGEPRGALRKVIVPIYLYHRYQVAAAAKLIGGFEFNYGVKGDALAPGRVVSAPDQRRALAALVETLDPAMHDLPDALLDQLTPVIGGFGPLAGDGEQLDGDTGPVFDIIAAADTSGAITMQALLHPERAARLVEQARRSRDALSLSDVFAALETKLFAAPAAQRQRRIAEVLQTRFTSTLIALS